MGSKSPTELLQLPVELNGIKLGQPVDVLLEQDSDRPLGLVVLCRDDVERFLVLATAEVKEEEIAVESALLLLDDVDFYRQRSRSLRATLAAE